MSTWQGAKLLVKYDWMSIGFGWLFNIAMLFYFIVTTTPLIMQLREGGQADSFAWVIDFIMLAIIPVLGFFMNMTTIGNWKQAKVARKIARIRLLPISYRQIALGRLLTMATIFTPTLLIYFGVQYVLVYHEFLTPLQFLNFGLQWYGYGIAVGSLYALMEMGLGGKAYLMYCFIIVVLILGVAILLSFNRIALVNHQLQAVQEGNWIWAIIMLAAAAISFAGTIRLMAWRLSRRSLLG
ncbi:MULTISPECIES: hypothetical protein [unclassified Paenibacillus]|uniref:hypothetical protein n=1 Tax=unclassified Paenibacillus TaxID=185978 RepID=UPI0009574BE0|nr:MULTISPECIES: hypothetical protein [unclassified Paenibacillus]ASS68527.1 hypothetical protein CIC07_22120 [Paenibacillus sp. RUD330]SIR36190.1 hypothetical protein SAMN05880555_3609 [Paenibacillus sp. RU4X]SIR46765.1 hypothetical protein SAMN05880570_3610 [Paenibacillus sp. RU4T]